MTLPDDPLRALRETFAAEAREHLQVLAQGLQQMARVPPAPAAAQAAAAAAMFRAAHSLKGAARAVEITSIETLCQALEDVLSRWRQRDAIVVPPATAALLQRALQMLGDLLGEDAAGRPSAPQLADLRRQLHGALDPQAAPHPAPPAGGLAVAAAGAAALPPLPGGGDTVRVTLAQLQTQLHAAEELLTVKLGAAQHAAELRDAQAGFAAWHKAWNDVRHTLAPLARRTAAAAPADLAPLLGFVDWNQRFVAGLQARLADMARDARRHHEHGGRQVDELLDGVRGLLALPFASVAPLLDKLVRDQCRDQRKEAALQLRGIEVEVDKRVLEELKDPLIHLLRNAVDHGIEMPAARRLAGKPPQASVAIDVALVAEHRVRIRIADDGAGIDAQALRRAAAAQGLLDQAAAAALADEPALQLAFHPGLSTAAQVTALSGRGLGLAIVHEKVTQLGGTVSLHSTPGRGTRFDIVVPARWPNFRGVLFEAGGQRMLLRTASVERVVRVPPAADAGGPRCVTVDGRPVALLPLAQVLGLEAGAAGGHAQALVVGTGDRQAAFAVDAVLDECEALLKPLRKPLQRLRHVAGAAVLGSGQLVPVLRGADLLQSARRLAERAPAADAAPRRSVLIAEDSITSRLLLKGLLEAAGYRVGLAADGLDALALLRSRPFDLLVSDVEMPGLNGFDLTAQVRGDPALKRLPVVLLTSRDARVDRERGLAAGADAYLTKGGFEQDELLAAVRRLL